MLNWLIRTNISHPVQPDLLAWQNMEPEVTMGQSSFTTQPQPKSESRYANIEQWFVFTKRYSAKSDILSRKFTTMTHVGGAFNKKCH